jgi:hypothetical protein
MKDRAHYFAAETRETAGVEQNSGRGRVLFADFTSFRLCRLSLAVSLSSRTTAGALSLVSTNLS